MPVPSRKILLADDSVTIQKVVNLTFAEEGIEVITTDDGDTALARIWEDRPDVVLADVNMPGATGYQVCEALRRTEATQHIPVILLVGSFEPFDEAVADLGRVQQLRQRVVGEKRHGAFEQALMYTSREEQNGKKLADAQRENVMNLWATEAISVIETGKCTRTPPVPANLREICM